MTRVLLMHERYRERGGEDRVFEQEVALLRSFGVDVVTDVSDNRDIDGEGDLALALRALWSPSSYRRVRRLLRGSDVDILHVHNSFPLLSPSVYDAAATEGVPVVQTLHNFRPLCPNALLMRDGHPCEDCLPRRIKWPAVLHACYRDSRRASAAVAAMSGMHHLLGTWRTKVDRFIALCHFSRDRFIAGGLPADRVMVKPAGCPDPGPQAADWNRTRSGALFVGRLSVEKGLAPLLTAWSGLDRRETSLTVIGEGPLAPDGVQGLASDAGAPVRFTGRLAPDIVSAAMAGARILAVPSLCYENAPLAAIEAFAHGLPVLASDLGAMREIVTPEVTGLLVRPGDVGHWRASLDRMLADPDLCRRMGEAARRDWESRYAPRALFAAQMEIYRDIQEARPRCR